MVLSIGDATRIPLNPPSPLLCHFVTPQLCPALAESQRLLPTMRSALFIHHPPKKNPQTPFSGQNQPLTPTHLHSQLLPCFYHFLKVISNFLGEFFLSPPRKTQPENSCWGVMSSGWYPVRTVPQPISGGSADAPITERSGDVIGGGSTGPPPGWDAPREPPAPALNEPEERGEAA